MPLTPTPPSPPRRRVLIVATEPATLRLCNDVLNNSGIAVDIAVADSGVAAVVAAREDVPDLIFVDIQLRDVPGHEAIRWLRSIPALQSTPISMLAPDTEVDAVFGITHKVPQLCKPVSITSIKRTVEQNSRMGFASVRNALGVKNKLRQAGR
jgi:DNA-binding response OmpR family regulator